MAQELEGLLDTRQELVVVEERNRMARDLHDSVKQQAFAASAQISTAKKLLAQNPNKAFENIEEAERLTNALRKELTNLIQEMRSPALEGKGLATALQDYSHNWSRQNETELEIRLQGERPLPLDVEQTVFRIVQEALANVARHSNANKVEIGLVYTSKELTCIIRDNGCGFDPTQALLGFGIRSMQERAKTVGSQLNLESTTGEGTIITFALKLDNSLSHTEEIEAMSDPIRILLVDDHEIVRQGVRAFFDAQEGIEVIGEAGSGAAAVKMIEEYVPDVVLMDLIMPGMDGVEATRLAKSISPRTQIVVLTSYHEDEHIFPALQAGALSYILKDVAMDELAEVVFKASRGEATLHPQVASRVIQELHGRIKIRTLLLST